MLVRKWQSKDLLSDPTGTKVYQASEHPNSRAKIENQQKYHIRSHTVPMFSCTFPTNISHLIAPTTQLQNAPQPPSQAHLPPHPPHNLPRLWTQSMHRRHAPTSPRGNLNNLPLRRRDRLRRDHQERMRDPRLPRTIAYTQYSLRLSQQRCHCFTAAIPR